MRTVRRAAALKALWAAVRRQRRPGSPSIPSLLAAAPRLAAATLTGRYPGLDRGRLGLMALAALYVVSPVDLVPEAALLLVGFADDAMVLAWLAGALISETDAFVRWEKQQSPSRPGHRPAGEQVLSGEVIA